MGKVINHQLLEQIGDPRKMSQRQLDQVMDRSEQALGISEKGMTSRILSIFIPKEGISRPLAFNDVIEGLGKVGADKANDVQTVLDILEESKVLFTNEACSYQLASNVLASQFFNKKGPAFPGESF